MTVEVPLTRGYVALIDDEDAPAILAHKWCAIVVRGRVYAMRSEPGNNAHKIYMSQDIIGECDGLVADHIDRDTLNNRRSNLRHITNAQRVARHRSRANPTGFRGVSRARGRWRASANKRYLGTFDTPEDAARAYDAAAREAFGEFATLNFAEAA